MMNPWLVITCFVAVRLITVFIIQTWFVPDEYWQTVEVAHRLTFGYGYLTWEWTHGIRSYIYPALLASVMSALKLLSADSVTAVIYAPRIFQAVVSAVGDYCFWKWYRHQNKESGFWAIFCLSTNWFWLYCGSRTLINSFEATLNTIALSWFPWKRSSIEETTPVFLWVVGIVCLIRPTASVIWLPLCVYHIASSNHKIELVVKHYLKVAVILGLFSILLDTYCYGRVSFTPLNFLIMNIMRNINVFYGTHPFHWYSTAGIPVVLGCHLVPFLLGIFRILVRERNHRDMILVFVIIWTVLILSFIPHKEFRFLLPLMPLFVYVETKWFSHWSRRAPQLVLYIVMSVMLVMNGILLGYLGMAHQRGSLDVMKILADKNPRNTSVLFLMPCHSTPLYSHLHSEIPVRFLTCEPNFKEDPFYVDEADMFYQNPEKWLQENFFNNGTVSHIVIYDSLHSSIQKFLSENHYKLNNSLHHSPHVNGRVGKFVQIYTNQK